MGCDTFDPEKLDPQGVKAICLFAHIAHVGPPGGVDVPFVGCDAFDPEELICLFAGPLLSNRYEDSFHIAHVGPLGGLDVPFGGKDSFDPMTMSPRGSR